MPSTYNPNELVKCKHLNAFAAQLAEKLGTNLQRTLTYLTLSTTGQAINLLTTDTANLTFADLKELGTNALLDKNYGYGIAFNLKYSAVIDAVPQIKNFESSITTNAWILGPLVLVNGANWYIPIGNPTKAAQTVSFTLYIPETKIYAEFSKDFTINITAGT